MSKRKKKILIGSLSFVFLFVLFLVFDLSTNSFGFVSNIRTYLEANSQPRKEYNFNYDWKFSIGEGVFNAESDYTHYCLKTDHSVCVDATTIPSDLYEVVSSIVVVPSTDPVYNDDYDISGFETVSAPDTYNDIDSFDNYNEGIDTQHGNRSTYSGTAWYKKEFFVPTTYENKKVYIEFEGVRQAMTVYINGQILDGSSPDDTDLDGKYENGFIPVGYDLTPFLKYGETNTITVLVDNSFPYYMDSAFTVNGSSTSSVLWHNSHWHPNYGGIYRNVNLYVMDELHLTLPLYSFIQGEGTYIYASNISDTTATVNVDPQIQNSSSSARTFDIKSSVYDINNNLVGSATTSSITLLAGAKNTYHLEINLTDVIRWSTDYPYLYTVKTEIIENGSTIDNNSDSIGIREFKITSDYGFYLNGNYEELNGWGQKSTMEWAGLGSAYPDWMTDYVIKLMKDANANYIRWGHTAGSPTQIESSDKYGLLVTQPGVDSEGNYNGTYDVNSAKLRVEAFRDMLIYYRNSPSIIMWEMGNEGSFNINFNENYISSIAGLSTTSTSASIWELLYTLIEQYDYGNRDTSVNNSDTWDNSTDESNRLVTVRRGSTVTKQYLDVEETTLGNITLAGSTYVEGEYNRLESPRRVWDKYTTGAILPTVSKNSSYYKTSEDFALSQIKDMGMITGQPGIVAATGNVGGANWIFSDSESHGRVDAEVLRASGEVDAVMLPKEAYYVDQVVFSKVPAIHVIGHWNYPADTIKPVYVAARNVSTVKLFVNDTSYNGTLSDSYLWTFSNVKYESGTIKAVGYDVNGNVVVEDSIVTHGDPASIKLTLLNSSEVLANGADIALVDVEIIDSNGNRCLTYDGESNSDYTRFTLSGDTNNFEWRGGYNSGIEYSTNKDYLYLEAGINRVSIKSTLNTGTVNLTATTDSGLTSNTLTITSNSVDNTNGVSSLLSTPSYDISLLSDPGVGSDDKLGITPVHVDVNSSVLISGFNYTGSDNDGNKIGDAFGPGAQIYSDSDVTFTQVPYKFYNGEYLVLPNADYDTTATDLITFTAKRNIDVYVLRDPALTTIPSWLATYTKTTDVVIGGNGITYDVYKISILKDDPVIIGGASMNHEAGVNQVIMFKETDKVNNRIFLNENFNDFDADSLNFGYYPYSAVNTSVDVSNDFDTPSLHFIDTNTAGASFIQKKFVPISNGKIEVAIKFYMKTYTSTAENNSWTRFWLTDEYIVADTDKSRLIAETYIMKDWKSLYYSARTVQGGTSTSQLSNEISGISLDAWHTYKILIDLDKKTYTIGVDDNWGTITYPFFTDNIDTISNIVVSTWKAAESNFYVDDITITPIMTDIISNAKVDGVAVASFSENVFNYYIEGLTSSSVVTFDKGEYFISSTQTYDPVEDRIILTVTDVVGAVKTYYFHNVSNVSLLDDWTVSADPNTRVEVVSKDGEDAIHMYDTSSTGMAYIVKEFEPQNKDFRVSWKTNVTTSANNAYLRMWLLDGPLSGPLIKTNAGVITYINRNGGSLNFTNEIDGSTTAIWEQGITNKWYDYQLIVHVETNTYDLYVDNELVTSGVSFNTNVASLDHITFGTRLSNSSDFYIKNIKVEPIYTPPLSEITVDGNLLLNFNVNTHDYVYYSSTGLVNDTSIVVSTSSDSFDRYTVERDLIEQKAIVTVYDKYGNVYVYNISFKNTGLLDVTKAQLLGLIESAAGYSKDEYSLPSYEDMERVLAEANAVYNNDSATQSEINEAYNNLEMAINNLIHMNDYNSYTSGTFDNIKYSDNLAGLFTIEKVLANDKKIYNNENVTFRSVPNRYYNAEYFLVNNVALTSRDEFRFRITTTRKVSVLIFRDRAAGEISDDSYTFTGDIVTGNNGVVYKVYKKDYDANSTISIDFKNLISNPITNQNAIIAIKDADDVANNLYFNQDFSKYPDTATFMKSWNVVNDLPGYNDVRIEEKDGQNALYLYSASDPWNTNSYSAAWASIRFADQTTGKFNINYKFYADPDAANNVNGYSRVFLISNTVLNQNTLTDDADKDTVIIDSYVDYSSAVPTGLPSYNLKLMYKLQVENLPINTVPLSRGVWYDTTYTVDMDSKTWSASVNGETATGLKFRNNLNPANILYLSNRKTGPTSMWYAGISVAPIENGYINQISVKDNVSSAVTNVLDYTSVTKDYLYRSSDVSDLSIVLEEDSDDTTVSTITNDTSYASILTNVSGTLKQDNRVYYELATDKKLLTQYANEALGLDSDIYTDASWRDLENALATAKEVLANSFATQEVIDAAAEELREKIDALVLKPTYNAFYIGSLYYGDNFNGSDLDTIFITNDSSFTFEALLDLDTSSYPYVGTFHDRDIVTDKPLPVGTKITMVDNSKDVPRYYYYVVNDTDDECIHIENFIKMGTKDTKYVDQSYFDDTLDKVYEDFIFIIDFEDVVNKPSKGEYSIKYRSTIDSYVVDMNYHLVHVTDDTDKFAVSTVSNSSSYSVTDDIDLRAIVNYTSARYDAVRASNTNKFSMNFGLRLSLYKNDVKVDLPAGLKISYLGNYYYSINNNVTIELDGVSALISYHDFVINLADDNFEAGTYTVKAELIESSNGINLGTVIASSEQKLVLTAKSTSALKVDLTSDSNVIHKGDAVALDYDISKLGASDPTIVVSLQTKEGTVIDLATYVTNSLTSFKTNEYDIGNVSNYTFNLNGTLDVGTYKFVFNLYDGTTYKTTIEKYILIK